MKKVHAENLVGNTPTLKVNLSQNDEVKTFIKLEGYNPTGSIKDRAALNIIRKNSDEYD